ncbi:MAG: SDR family oxidoreductase [Microbacterium sp.]
MTDHFGYQGRVSVVTGAASGMGRALAEILVDLGASVYAIDRVESPVEGITQAIVADLGDKNSIDAAFAELPEEIHSFFGVAGISGVHQSYLDTFTVNFIANKYITDTYLRDRVVQGGSLTFVTSNGGLRWENTDIREELQPLIEPSGWDGLVSAASAFNDRFGGAVPGSLGYILSKRALNYWIATEVGPLADLKKIRINAILPAMTISGMIGEFAEMKGGMDAVEADLGPAGRLAESVDMARVLAFLGSDLAGYVSGAHLCVDFGMNAQQLAGLAPDRLSWTLAGVMSRTSAS